MPRVVKTDLVVVAGLTRRGRDVHFGLDGIYRRSV
jgi:hypothetical protein